MPLQQLRRQPELPRNPELKVTDPMHTHHRRDDTDDTKGHRLEAAAESTFAKMLNRFGMPLLLGIVGFLGSEQLKDIRSGQDAQAKLQAAQARETAEMRTEIRVLTTRLDEVVIRQVNANGSQLIDHERRIQSLERAR